MQRVVIIGAGFSGTLTAAHLARAASQGAPLRTTIVERGARFARGVAYGTPHGACLLNVPAGRMSAFPDDPEHFLRWLRARNPNATGGAFPPRVTYGEYLGAILAEAERDAPPGALERAPGEAVRIDPPDSSGPGSPARVALRDGRTVEADSVVLAPGNFPPSDPAIADDSFYSSPRYFRDPWAPGAVETTPPGEAALLLGTGLTMLDVALSLKASGHTGVVHAVSRRGLLPQPHRVSVRPPRALKFPESLRPLLNGASAAELLRVIRAEVRAGAARGDDWREVVTSLRHETPALWRAMDERSKRQFLRHLQPFWDTHRHRAAPETAAGIADLMERGSLVPRAGRVLEFRDESTHVRVAIQRRDTGEVETLRVGRVINCTGPSTNLSRTRDALLASLRDAGLVRPDPLGLGLESDDAGRALDAQGTVVPWLRMIGPLRRPSLWETTAAPELRSHAVAMAKSLVREAGVTV